MKQVSEGFCDASQRGFDAHMYNGMFLNELTHANVVCVT